MHYYLNTIPNFAFIKFSFIFQRLFVSNIAPRISIFYCGFLEQIVADEPLVAARVGKQLGTRHEKHSPARQPQRCLVGAIGCGQTRAHWRHVRVAVDKPRLERARVVPAVDSPLSL